MYALIKVISTAVMIGIVTEVSRKYPTIGGIIASLPLVSVLSIIWLTFQGESSLRIGEFAKGVLWGFPASAFFLVIIIITVKHSIPLIYSLILGIVGWGLFVYTKFDFK